MSPSDDASTTQQAASKPVYEPISYPSADSTFGVQPGGWKSTAYDNSQPSSEPDMTWFPSNRSRDIQPAHQHQYLIPDLHTRDGPQPPHLAQHSYFTHTPHTIHQPPSTEQSYSFQHSSNGTPPPELASMTSALNADGASAVDSYFRRPPAVIRVNQACDKCRERKVRVRHCIFPVFVTLLYSCLFAFAWYIVFWRTPPLRSVQVSRSSLYLYTWQEYSY